MVAFNKMWDDVWNILSSDNIQDINITEKFKSGFIVKEKDNVTFITKDDFIDFWSRMQYYNEVSMEQLTLKDEIKLEYVYSIIKKLPYVCETKGILRLVQ